MNDLLNQWRALIAAEARAAAEAVVSERAAEVEHALSGAQEALARGAEARGRAESAASLAESLSEILARSPREMFLSDAALVVLTDRYVEDHDRIACDGAAAMELRLDSNRSISTLVQRHKAPLPPGHYAVVVSFHRIDGGGK